jgi:hypothetical protein
MPFALEEKRRLRLRLGNATPAPPQRRVRLERDTERKMPQENVEVLRRSFEAWNRNDWETLMACMPRT